MLTKSSAVKYKGKVVATIDIRQAQTVEEAIQIAGDEAKLLKIFNERIVVLEQNAARNANSDRPAGKQKLMKAAFAVLTQADYEVLKSIATDSKKVEEYLTSPEMQARVQEAVNAGLIKI